MTQLMAKPSLYYQDGIRQAPSVLRLPKRSTMIWRFMSLSKFLDLITRQSLFLGQLSGFQRTDPFEGSLGANRLAYLTRMMTDDSFARQELHLQDDEPIPGAVRASYSPDRNAWTNERSADRTYISCWHINAVESANLWSVYTAQGEGVAIQSTIGSLLASLGTHTKHVTVAPVRYIDHQTFELGPSPEEAAFYKRVSFKAERELRIRHLLPIDRCLEDREGRKFWAPPAGIYMSIDCDCLIEKVFISPTLGDWFRDSVESLLVRLGLNKDVVKSTISDPRIL